MCISSPRAWAHARSYCVQQGYGSVQIEASGAESFLEAEDRNLGWNNRWIGRNDMRIESPWSWVRSNSTYTNWQPGQPDNYLGNEDCATDRFSSPDGTWRGELWNDDRCDRAYAFICERPANASSFFYNTSN